MRINPKKLKIIFIASLFLFSFSFLILPHIVYAQTNIEDYCKVTEADVAGGKAIRLNIGFSVPDVIYKSTTDGRYYTKDMGCYIGGFYKYFAGVAGILAAVMIMWGGYKYITSFGNASRMNDGKNTIYQALFGLVLLLASYVILYTINPNLVSLQMPNIDPIGKILLATKWCPKDAVQLEGSTDCGKKGTIAKEGEKGGECRFNKCTELGKICYQGTEDDPAAEVFNCASPKEACEKLQAHGNDDAIKALCPTRSITDPAQVGLLAGQVQLGRCSWFDVTWWWPANDRCNWQAKFTCLQGYHRAACSKCKEHDYNGNGCDWWGPSLPPIQAACVDGIDVHAGDTSQVKATLSGYKYATICCEADNLTGANSDYHCVDLNGVDIM